MVVVEKIARPSHFDVFLRSPSKLSIFCEAIAAQEIATRSRTPSLLVASTLNKLALVSYWQDPETYAHRGAALLLSIVLCGREMSAMFDIQPIALPLP
jgi:hypothetical protein